MITPLASKFKEKRNTRLMSSKMSPTEHNIKNNPLVLIILDGWGVAPPTDGNAIAAAETPFFDHLLENYPTAVLAAAGRELGLKAGRAASCEQGHYIIGGRAGEKSRTGLVGALSGHGYQTLCIAEAEKFPLLAGFFCSGAESDKSVQSLLAPSLAKEDPIAKPQLSLPWIVRKITGAARRRQADFIVANLSNADILGHAGDFEAARQAVEHLDKALEKISKSVLGQKGTLVICSDHGNAEQMADMASGSPDLEHTANPVPFLAASKEYLGRNFGWPGAGGPDMSLLPLSGTIADIAPTVLHLFGLAKPEKMPGKNLIQ